MPFRCPTQKRFIRRRDFLRLAALGSAGALIGLPDRPAAAIPGRPRWPSEEWPVSTPEAQGMDSAKLAALLTFCDQQRYRINSLLVIRHGHIAAEAYSPRTPQDEPIALGCASKGFINTLTGIALAEGFIESLDQPVLSFFPGRTFDNMDEKKEALTVEDVLAVRTGLLWSWASDGSAMQYSDDWLQYVLDKPIGDRIGYAQQAHVYLMSAILQTAIQEATGGDALVLAHERLFDPLGIADAAWDISPEGAPSHLGLHLPLREVAKWGYLYLNQGMWDDQQLVPADWVDASTSSQTEVTSEEDYLSFGYLMNIYDFGAYASQGTDSSGPNGTAAIVVLPEQDMIFAFNIYKRIYGCRMIKTLCEDHVIPAAVSDEPLPENPAALAELEALIEEIETEA